MFNKDFFPTPLHVIETMLAGEKLAGKNVLEPEAGRGDIVDYCIGAGAIVSACEIEPDLQQILFSKCRVIAPDFLTLKAEHISHIDLIVMNPPFSADEKHILHAFEIAPPGCKVIALCNWQTIDNRFSSSRKRLSGLIKDFGTSENLGDCFADADRKTGIDIGMITLLKPGGSYENEFEGFFMDEDPEEAQYNGLIPYNFVRDVVNRYVAAVKLYDEQLATGLKMNNLLNGFYGSNLSFSCTQQGQPILRNEFKKDLQKSAWNFIIAKMKMEKYTTQSLKADLNTFVEKQHKVPFTMQNIYHMLQLIVGTHADRMGKALIAIFDRLTTNYHENRYNVEGWKTNSHFLVNEKFILNYMCSVDKWHSGNRVSTGYGSNFELVEDLIKSLCYYLGENYDDEISLSLFLKYPYKVLKNGKYGGYESCFDTYERAFDYKTRLYNNGIIATIEYSEAIYGSWLSWGYFDIKCFKKGTIHFKFKDKEVWGRFNQIIAKLKGYPLYEHKKSAA